MDSLVDAFGRKLTEELDEEIATVSTPKFVANAVPYTALNQICESEYKMTEFVDFVDRLKIPLNFSLFRKQRFPTMEDETAKVLEASIVDLLEQSKHRLHGIYMGAGKVFIAYVIDVARNIEIVKSSGVSEDEAGKSLYWHHTRALSEMFEGKLSEVDKKFGNNAYV